MYQGKMIIRHRDDATNQQDLNGDIASWDDANIWETAGEVRKLSLEKKPLLTLFEYFSTGAKYMRGNQV